MGPKPQGFSTIVTVGPGERELARLADLLAGLDRFESSALHQLIIVDDSRGALDFSAVANATPSMNVKVVVAPRLGKGHAWRGGLCTNVLFGLKHAFADGKAGFVVKVDTDSLIISPFSKRVAACFDRQPKLGMVGSLYKLDLHGNPIPASTWKPNLKKWESLFRLRRNPRPHIETGLYGRNRLIRQYLKMALANGWDAGTCAVGGGYAIRKDVFDSWSTHQMLADDLLWLDTDLGEDVVVSLLCNAIGFVAGDDNGPGGVFGVQAEGLGFSPAEMIARGYGIVHSIKLKSWEDELALRREFQRRLDCTPL